MSDPVLWVIIIAFYAPLHYMMPILMVFILGKETGDERKARVRKAIQDATVSMVLAFALAIFIMMQGEMLWAMIVLFVSMFMPFIRILLHRAVAPQSLG